MPTKTQARWISKLRSACPKGWSVKESRGKVRLSVRSGRTGTDAATSATVTLPLAWAADTLEEAQAEILRIKGLVDEGQDLKAALRGQAAPITAGVTSASTWVDLVKAFRIDLTSSGNEIKATTWTDSYKRALDRMVELMASTDAPVDGPELIKAVALTWQGKPRARELAVNAVRACLNFGIETKRLPAATWWVGDHTARREKGKKSPKRTVATPTDAEWLQLIRSIKDDRWKNALKLLVVYGLRPEELHWLQPRLHPQTQKPALWCGYAKPCGATRTDPRWLMPLPLTNASGNLIEWEIPELMLANQFQLPPLGTKYALLTFLKRQPAWQELSAKYAAAGQWLRPYSPRNSYSLRAHQRGLRLDLICMAMGHSLAVHQRSYEWARDTTVLEHIG